MTKTLSTERLTLRPVSSGDEFDFFPLCSHVTAVRYLPTTPHKTAAETAAWIASKISKSGAYLWAMLLEESDRPIGFVNYLGESRIPGLGYVVHPDYWGQGYAPEACRAVLDYGFTHLGLDRVELWIDESNAASHRVAQKLRFKVKGRIPVKHNHQLTVHSLVVYGIRAAEWAAGHAAAAVQPTRIFRVEPVLSVPDVLAAANYYRDKLGFQIDFVYGDPPAHAAVSRVEWTGSGATIQLSQAEAGHVSPPSGCLYFFTDTALDTLYTAYRQRGVAIVSEPQDRPWGLREFSIRDLNGYLLIFATY